MTDTFTLDYETFFSQDYSLRKMPPLAYIRDPRFKAHGCAIKQGEAPAEWVTGRHLAEAFHDLRLTEATVVSHNANFDMTILHERYGITPARYVDTLGLCRALLPRGLDFSLGAIAPLLGVGEKGTELESAKGIRDLSPEIEQALASYAENDAELAYGIFALLYPHLPEMERDALNLVVRMSTNGVLRWNPEVAAKAKQALVDSRNRKLAKINATPTDLRSRDKFAALLTELGVEPPSKVSARTGKETHAFSKQDPEFVKLRAHPNPAVRDLVEARIAWSSNNAIKRIDNLTTICALPPRTLPVQLNFHGAHTGRLSGGGGINTQNFNARGEGKELRHAIEAPPGHVIVVQDLNAIELRINMWFCGQTDVLDKMARGDDVYVEEAERQLHLPPGSVDKNTPEGKKQRGYGKAVRLGAQYQMGPPRFRDYCAAGPLGLDPIYLSEQEAVSAISIHRSGIPKVVGMWHYLQNVAIPMMLREDANLQIGPIIVQHESILLPNGLSLHYPELRCSENNQWTCGFGNERSKVYGGIVLENIVQALAGIGIKEKMLLVQKELGYLTTVAHQVHDEILSVCREEHGKEVNERTAGIMTRPISWAPDLPLESEGGFAYNYTK